MSQRYIPDQLRGNPEDADGIEEYDNRLPAWWVGLFYLTIVWAIITLVDWHVLSPKTQVDFYEAELANAPQPVSLDDIEVVISPEAIAAGQSTFVSFCAACHMADGTGGIGPDLTDSEWLHGGTPEEILHTVALGVLEKGMPSWLGPLGADGCANVTAYVYSLSQ